jgi:hypothetical protein
LLIAAILFGLLSDTSQPLFEDCTYDFTYSAAARPGIYDDTLFEAFAKSPLLLITPGSLYILNTPVPHWQRIPSWHVSFMLKVYAPLVMYTVLEIAPPSKNFW